MPLLLSPHELRTDMQLCQPVVRGHRVLLPAGRLLTSADVASLRRKYPDQQVHVVDPALEEMVEFADDSHDRTVARTAQRRLFRALSGVKRKFAAQLSLKHMDLTGLQEAVADVVEYVRTNQVAAAILAQHVGTGHYLTEHATNVFYLSLVLGNAVRGYVQRVQEERWAWGSLPPVPPLNLTPLGLAAMFQDVSLWPLASLYQTCAPLTGEQRELIYRHPQASVEMLPPATPAGTAQGVQMHHESFDGSGYPEGLSGDQIHLFARALRICDAFDAATAANIYSRAKSPVRALGEMTLGPYSRFYDPLLLKVFSHLVQPFPIGAKLRLACGRYGVIVRYGETDPFRPVVLIAFDRDGSRLPRNRMEGPHALSAHPELRIQSFRGEDLSDLYNGELAQAEPLVLTEFATLFDSTYP